MKVLMLEREQRVERPLGEVFSFFERPENLADITPPELGLVILSPTPITMREGALIDYSVKVMGVRLHWTTLISEYDPPHKFVDVQLRGPYSFWHHTHEFLAVDGGTAIRDCVRYVLPLGWPGQLVHRFVVQPQLHRIFDYRSEVIKDHFKSAPPKSQFGATVNRE